LIISTLAIFLVYLIPNPVDLNGSIKVALIQGGVVNLGLDFNDKPKEVFIRHVNQTQKSITENQVDLIAWPENAVDVDVFKNKDVMESITELSKNLSTPILVGGVTNSPNPRNQSMLFAPKFTQVYTKRYLTPFGEYLPFREIAEKVSPYAGQVNDFDAGSNPVVFQVDDYQFRSLICYELLDDRFVNENNQDFLVIQTNNATFGDTAQLDQQLNIAKVRAAESFRHIAYVSTTGITSFIDPHGKVQSTLDKFTAGTLISEMQISNGSTYAQRFGWLVEPLAIIALLILFFIRRWGRQ
jgi:apolipoprotein N-acyltransferase